jgi:hypothetical protein
VPRSYAVRVGYPSAGSALNNRPNDGSGFWPDASNTGHTKGPNATASPADYTTGMTAGGGVFVQEANATVLTGKRFLGKSYVGYSGVGDNLVFRSCLFEGTWPNDSLVQVYCPTTVRFEYCTFKPAGVSAPPGNTGYTRSTAITSPGTPYTSSWQYIAGLTAGQVATFDHCDVWGNAGIEMTGGTGAGNQGTFSACYIHDQADNDGSGGSGYHHDGIGPDSTGGAGYTLINGCTIASLGNTNGIALQGSATYHHITITNNYISGWGYAVSIGATTPWQGTNITVTGNIYSAEVDSVFGPFYNVGNWNTGSGTNTWSGNRFQVRSGDQETAYGTSDHGRYWWPSDNVSHATDF